MGPGRSRWVGAFARSDASTGAFSLRRWPTWVAIVLAWSLVVGVGGWDRAAAQLSDSRGGGIPELPAPRKDRSVPGQLPMPERSGDEELNTSLPSGVMRAGSVGAPPGVTAERKVPVSDVKAEWTENSRVVENADGSRTLESSMERINFRDSAGAWQRIDTRVVGDRERKGVFVNAADAYRAEFGPLPSFGVRVETPDGGSISFRPDVEKSVEPSVSSDGQWVTYREVWPGVDVRYRVTPSGVKEDVVVKEKSAGAAFRFRLNGATSVEIDESGRSAEVGKVGESLRLTVPEVMTRSGAIDHSVADPTLATRAAGGGERLLTVAADSKWFEALPTSEFPVVIDPSTTWGATYENLVRTSNGQGECTHASQSCWNAKVGTFLGVRARSYGRYDLSDLQWYVQNGWSVGSAKFSLQAVLDGYWNLPHAARTFIAFDQTSLTPVNWLPTVDTYAFGSLANPPIGSVQLNATSGSGEIQVGAPTVQGWATNSARDFGFGGDENTQTTSVMNTEWPLLVVTMQNAGPWGHAWAPQDGAPVASTLPRLYAIAEDADMTDPISLRYTICETDAEGAPVSATCWNSGWIYAGTTAPYGSLGHSYDIPPAHRLAWGRYYTWQLEVSDGSATYYTNEWDNFIATIPSTSPLYQIGTGPSGVSDNGVNVATGNYSIQQTDASVATVGPELDLVRTYNTLDTRIGAFGRGWSSPFESTVSWNSDPNAPGYTVSRADGRNEFYGQNPDGVTYVPPLGVQSKLTKSGNDLTVTEVDQTQYRFDVAAGSPTFGKLTRITNENGHYVTLTYGAAGNRLSQVQDQRSARSLFFTWTTTGTPKIATVKTDSVTGQGQLTWSYSYTNDTLVDVWDPHHGGGAHVHFNYDASLRMSSWTLPRGNFGAQLTYWSSGRVKTRTDGMGKITNYSEPIVDGTIPGESARVTVTDPRSYATEYGFDPHQRLIRRRNPDPAGTTRRWSFDAKGHLAAITFDDLTVESYLNDANGNVLTKTDAAQQAWTFTYDTGNRVISETVPGDVTTPGYQTQYTYNAITGNLETTVRPAPLGTTTNTYTTGTEAAFGSAGTQPPNLLKASTEPGTNATNYSYNAKGDLTKVVDPAGKTTEFTYDEIGRELTRVEKSTSYPAGVTWTTGYDKLSRVVSVREPASQNRVTGVNHQIETATWWDANSNRTQEQSWDLVGGGGSRTEQWAYDNEDRETTNWKWPHSVASITYKEYDNAGNLSAVIDPNGRRFETTFNSRNLPETTILKAYQADPHNNSVPFDLTLRTVTYDAMGRRFNETDAEGRVRMYLYTGTGLLDTVTLMNFANRDGSTRNIVLEDNNYSPAGDLREKYEGNSFRRTTTTWSVGLKTGETIANTSVPASPVTERTSTYTYDSAGRMTKEVRSGLGTATDRETRLLFNAAGQNYRQEVENGTTDLNTQFGYDSRGLRTSVTDPNGNTTDTTYDELGRPLSTKLASVSNESGGGTPVSSRPETKFGYDSWGGRTEVLDPRAQLTTTQYDGMGRQTQISHPSYTPPGGTAITPTEQFGYDGNSNLTQRLDRRGKWSYFFFDKLNRAYRADTPGTTAGTTATSLTLFDKVGKTIRTTSPTGAVVNATFDMLNRQRTQTTVERYPSLKNLTTTFDYDDLGRLTWQNDPLNQLTTSTYNASGEAKSTTDPLAHTKTYTISPFGETIVTADALDFRREATFDRAGRQLTEKNTGYQGTQPPLATSYQYDNNGNRTRATSPAGRRTDLTYDAANRLTSVVEGAGTGSATTTSYFYDAASNNTRIRNGRNYDTILTYQSWNLPESTIEPATVAGQAEANRRWRRSYDAGGLPIKDEQPGNVRIDRTFSESGRLTAESGVGATGSRTYGYDLAGRRTTVNHPNAQIGINYNDRGQPLTITGGRVAVGVTDTSYSYTDTGLVSQRVDANGTTDVQYDAASRLYYTTDPLTGGLIVNTYVDNDLPASRIIAPPPYTGVLPTWNFAYDAYGRLMRESYAPAGQPPSSNSFYARDYTLDADSQVLTETISPNNSTVADPGVQTYTYDPLGRLKTWQVGTGTTTTYNYDGAGNRTQAGTKTFTFDAQNRLTAGDGKTYTWSLRGTLDSVVGGGTTNSTFDAFGLPLTQGATSYGYDGLGRIANRNGSQTFAYAGLGMDPISDGTWQTSLDPKGDPLAVKTGTTARWALMDRRHDLVAFVNAAGTALDSSVAYNPYGEVTARTGTMTPSVGYQADWTDPTTGDVWMGARFYRPAADTFTSRDTDPGTLQTPVTLNRYTYAGNDPIQNWDPDGHRMDADIWGHKQFKVTKEQIFWANMLRAANAAKAKQQKAKAVKAAAAAKRSQVWRSKDCAMSNGCRLPETQVQTYLRNRAYLKENPRALYPPNMSREGLQRARQAEDYRLNTIKQQSTLSKKADVRAYLGHEKRCQTSWGECEAAIHLIRNGGATARKQAAALPAQLCQQGRGPGNGYYCDSGGTRPDPVANFVQDTIVTAGVGSLAKAGGTIIARAVATSGAESVAAATADDVVRVAISRSRWPGAAQHIDDAIEAGHPSYLTVERSGAASRRAAAMRGTSPKAGLDRDEFPPSMFQEGGEGASVRYIDPSDNRGAGASMGNQCRSLPDGTVVQIVTEC